MEFPCVSGLKLMTPLLSFPSMGMKGDPPFSVVNI